MKSYKNQLLTTSALVGAASVVGAPALAEAMDPSISVGGFFFHDTHFVSQDMDTNQGSVAHYTDAEVIFGLNGELENGLRIGGRVELEGITGGDQIDETRLDISGAWGMVRLGMSNSGRYGHTWSVAGPNVAHGVSSGVQTEWLDYVSVLGKGTGGMFFRQPLGSAHTDISNDDPAITYFSPRFNGFQFTATHRPTVQGGGSGGKNIGLANEVAADTPASIKHMGGDHVDTPAAVVPGDYTDAVDVSAQYQGDIGGVGVTLMAGAASASASSDAGKCGEDDYQAVNGGVRLSAMGFSVGGIMSDVDDEQRCGSGTAFHVGASYGQGPWAISVTAHDGDHSQSATAGEAELTVWAVGARYTLGPGVRLLASFQNAELTNEAGATNEGQAFTAGIAVNF